METYDIGNLPHSRHVFAVMAESSAILGVIAASFSLLAAFINQILPLFKKNFFIAHFLTT